MALPLQKGEAWELFAIETPAETYARLERVDLRLKNEFRKLLDELRERYGPEEAWRLIRADPRYFPGGRQVITVAAKAKPQLPVIPPPRRTFAGRLAGKDKTANPRPAPKTPPARLTPSPDPPPANPLPAASAEATGPALVEPVKAPPIYAVPSEGLRRLGGAEDESEGLPFPTAAPALIPWTDLPSDSNYEAEVEWVNSQYFHVVRVEGQKVYFRWDLARRRPPNYSAISLMQWASRNETKFREMWAKLQKNGGEEESTALLQDRKSVAEIRRMLKELEEKGDESERDDDWKDDRPGEAEN